MMPGLRVVMERVLTDDWLFLVRDEFIFKDAIKAQELSQIDDHKQIVSQIVPLSQQPRILAMLDFYRSMALYRTNRVADAAKQLAEAQLAMFKADKPKAKLTAADLLGDSKPGKADSEQPTAQESDDTVYFSSLQRLMARDAE